MSRIGVFYEHILDACRQRDMNVNDVIGQAVNAGITGLECDLWRLEDKSVKSLFDGTGIGVISIYNMYDLGHGDKNAQEKRWHQHFETAAYYGADKILCVPGFIEKGDNADVIMGRTAKLLNMMCEAAKDYGITVTLEDYDDIKSPCCTTNGLVYFMENVNGLRYAFDTGNFAYCCEDAGTAYDRLKGYVSHVHLKDRSFDAARADKDNTNGKLTTDGRVMYPCETGDGFIGIEGLIKRLIADGYKGDYSVEHFGAADQLAYMIKSAENVKRMIGE